MRRAVILFLGVVSLFAASEANAQAPNTIVTVAGGGTNSGAANTWTLTQPPDAVRDALGNTYFSDPVQCVVYKVDTTGALSIYAGSGIFGVGGDGGPASSAQLTGPAGLALDANGNLFIADSMNNRIRRVDVNTHIITTVAGSEDPFIGGYSGDGGLATLARLNQPLEVAVDTNGNLFISDSGNNVIRRVDAQTQFISTYAGNGLPGTPGTANGDGGPAKNAQLNAPVGLAIDGSGNLYIADGNDSVIRLVNAQTLVITTYAGSPAQRGTFGGDGGPAASAGLNGPFGIFLDGNGNLYIADQSNDRIRFVAAAGTHTISTVAGNGTLCLNPASACGDGAAATAASLNHPASAFLDNTNKLLIADLGDQRIRVVSGGIISNFAAGASGGDGGPATSANLGLPNSLVVDGSGNLFILEQYGERVRRVDATTHNISTFAGTGARGKRASSNGDGGPAVNAAFIDGFGITMDGSGNFYIVDFRAAVVRKIAANGIISTVAGNGLRCGEPGNAVVPPACGDGTQATSASLLQPAGVAVDSLGNIYVSDVALNRIRVVTPQGLINNYAGTGTAGYSGDNGDPTLANLNAPFGMAVDSQGNLFFADSNNNRIREVGADGGNITTYAFNGTPGFGGDGGSAFEASMTMPQQVTLDSSGNLYIGGGIDNVVRRVDAQDQSIITVAGDIENLAGGFSGDGGPSTKALIGNLGTAIDKSHNLYIADGFQRIRKVNLLPVATESGTFTAFPPTLNGTLVFNAPTQDIFFTNSGLDDLILTITSPAPGSAFQVQFGTCANPCIVVIPPGESGTIDVAFAPLAGGPTGTITGALTLTTNDPANPSLNFTLSGTATNTSETLNVTVTPDADGFVVSAPSGISCGVSPAQVCSAVFAQNSQVTLSASPATSGFTFSGWSGAGCSGTADCTVSMTQAQNVTATFTTATGGNVPVTVSAIGNGSGTITSSPAGINCTYNGTVASGTCTANFPPTGPVTLTATPSAAPNSTFAGWLGFCGTLGTNTCQTFPVVGVTTTAVFSVPPQPFAQGQVFAGAAGGMIFVYSPTGTLVQVLGSGNIGGNIGGIAFDSNGNLYAANPTAILANNTGTVERFGSDGSGPTTFGTGPFGNGYESNPQSVVVSPTGEVYVAQAADRQSLLKFPAAGGPASQEFFPPDDTGPMQWIELLDDNSTMLYTTAGTIVKSFDVLDNIYHPDFAMNLPGPAAFSLREAADKTVFVADGDRIVRLSQGGTVINTYRAGTGVYHSVNLDPDGVSFWTLEDVNGTMFRINMNTGAIITQFSTGVSLTLNAFNGFEGGLAVFGQPQSGGADVQLTMSASPSPATLNSPLTYTIVVKNNGLLTADNVAMTDAFPAGASVVSATSTQGTCTGGAIRTCNIGTLANGASATITIVVTPVLTGTLTNTANVNSSTPDPISSDNSATTNTTVNGPSATHFSVTAPATATNGTAFTITVTALDATNATVTGYGGTVHFTSSDPLAVLPANATLTGGVGTFSVNLKTNGSETVTATDTVTASITGTTGAIVVAPPATATHFSVTAPATATAGTPFSFTVTALDATNATVTSYGGTVHFTSSDGAAVLPANITLTNGTGTLSATLKTAGNQTITATDTVTASITGTSGTIAISAGAATHFAVAAPASATSGTAFNFTVTALDASNNTATTYAGTVHFTSTDGQAVLPANSGFASGVGTFSATLKTAGNQTITATDTVTASIAGTSGTINVGAALATHFSVAAPATATAGTAFNFTVTALTATNATATGYTGTVHFTSSDANAVLPANAILASGVGTFSATLNTVASETITATDTVTAAITGVSQQIGVVAAGANLSILKSGPATAPANSSATYTIVITNNGPQAAANVGMTDPLPLPLGIPHIIAPPTGCLVSRNVDSGQSTVGCAFATLANAGSITIMYSVNLPASGSLTNTATVTADNNTNTTTNSSSVTTTIGGSGPTLTSIAVTPLSATIAAAQTQQFTATGTFSDGSTQNLTATAAWVSSLPGVATISNTAGTQGLATAVGNGTTVITATSGSVVGTGILTVAPPIGFVLTGNLNVARTLSTATLLNNGTVLLAAGGTTTAVLSSAELFNPASGTFTATGSMTTARQGHTATLLPNGMVLLAGGFGSLTSQGSELASAELFNPATGTFAATGNMTTARAGHTATLLANGMVLIAGGANASGTTLSSAELYNPATGTFTATGSMIAVRQFFTATLLNDGTVLVAGGSGAGGTLGTAEIYNPGTGTFAATGNLTAVRNSHTATLLNSGMVLLAGGFDNALNSLASAELYNPTAGTFAATGNMTTTRVFDAASLLTNGMVLISGGYIYRGQNTFVAVPSAELYDPASGTFAETGQMNTSRDDHTSTLLTNGKVLVAGGDNLSCNFNQCTGAILGSAELYTPATMTPPGLNAITLSPLNPSIPVGPFQRFVATGTFTSGGPETLASVIWSSSNTAVATITNDAGSKGFADDSPGTTTITATAGAISGSTVLTVTGAAATHFVVSAPSAATAGTAFTFTVTAKDAGNDTVTSYAGTVHFTSTDGQATLPPNSTLTGGVGTFSATLNTAGSQTITATDTQTPSITGTSGAINVTAVAAPLLTVQIQGTGAGTVTGAGINCTSGSANGCTANVTAATQLTLTATFGANSAFTSWSAPCPNTTSPTCTFTMPAVATTIIATFTLNAPTLKSIAVTPANPTVAINSTQQFTATGTYSDNSTKDITATVTWASSNGDAASINAAGLASTGPTADLSSTISATLNDVTGSTTLTTTNSPIKISVTPPPGGVIPPVPPGGKLAVGIVLTATPGFSGTVTFGCTVTGADGQPAPSITCVPNPSSVTLSPGGPTQEAIVINTFCTAATVPLGQNPGGFPGGMGLLLLSLALGGVVWMYRRSPRMAVSFAVLVLFALGGAACSSLPKGPSGATPPGNYVLTITATVNGTTVVAPPVDFTVQ